MKEFIITSSIYPAIILLISFGVMILIFTVFIPRFSKIFLGMGKELPLSTAILVNIGNTVISLWWIWPILMLFAAGLAVRIKHNPQTRYRWDAFLLKIPFIGKIIIANEMNRFIHTMSILLKNHVKLLDAVEVGQRIIQNSCIRRSMNNLKQELRNGIPLSTSLSKSSYMPKDAVQMLKVGEESGDIELSGDGFWDIYPNTHICY